MKQEWERTEAKNPQGVLPGIGGHECYADHADHECYAGAESDASLTKPSADLLWCHIKPICPDDVPFYSTLAGL